MFTIERLSRVITRISDWFVPLGWSSGGVPFFEAKDFQFESHQRR